MEMQFLNFLLNNVNKMGLTQTGTLQVTSQWAELTKEHCYSLFSSQKKSQKEHSNPKEQKYGLNFFSAPK